LTYSRTDYERIAMALHQVNEAIDAAVAAVARGDADAAVQAITRARDEKYRAVGAFPAIVVNDTTTLTFEEVYADLYSVDLLIIIALQWPDPAPTTMTEMKELTDALDDRVADLRRLRAQPWAPGREEALAGLDILIDKTEELRGALEVLPPRARLDPRKFPWLGHELKAQFLNGVGEVAELGAMYLNLFSLGHAIDRAQWSVVNAKLPGANRRLMEAKRVHQLLLDWLREHPVGE
jgi:hypothetical protein